MKRLFFLAALICAINVQHTFAQGSIIGADWLANDTKYQTKYTALDTLLNATTKTKTAKVTECAQSVTFQLNRINISNGGTNGGTWDIYGSLDGLKYVLLTSVSITSPTTQYGYTIVGNPWGYYKYIITDTSTQTTSYQGFINVVRYPGK